MHKRLTCRLSILADKWAKDTWVSGWLGNASGCLFLLNEGLSSESHLRKHLIQAHQRAEDLRHLSEETGRNPMDWALYGGEDYELLFTAPPAHRKALEAMGRQNSDTPIHRIGKIVAKPVFSLVGTEGARDIGPHGYSHFSR